MSQNDAFPLDLASWLFERYFLSFDLVLGVLGRGCHQLLFGSIGIASQRQREDCERIWVSVPVFEMAIIDERDKGHGPIAHRTARMPAHTTLPLLAEQR